MLITLFFSQIDSIHSLCMSILQGDYADFTLVQDLTNRNQNQRINKWT